MTRKPVLSFEFINTSGEIKPKTFTDPIKIIEAHRLEEVIPALEQVQNSVKLGYYAAGYLSYESAPAFHPKYKVVDGAKMPLLWFGIFSQADEMSLQSDGEYQIDNWVPSTTKVEYDEAIHSIKDAIKRGETNQTNYTTRLHSQFKGDAIAFFNKLKRAQDSNYCAYLDIGDYQILSASPELFFHWKEDFIKTRPMKGTIKRGRTLEEDREVASWLYHSEKNRTENRMIVDLLRSELERIAEPNSVHVPKLFEIEKYPTVHQMTSTVEAKVKENTEIVDIFRALFPCGSITGAPKTKTMEIISEIETTPREVYCGAIGYITPDNEAIFNVPIRTVAMDKNTGKAMYGAGGGITWDSTSTGEYEEMLVKASLLEEERPAFQLLESLLLDNGSYFLLEEHVKRINESAVYFGYPLDEEMMKNSIIRFAKDYPNGKYKVRVLYSKNGTVQIEADPIKEDVNLKKVRLADSPIDWNNPFYYHKTTNRSMYSSFKEENNLYDVLLWNEDEEVTEFTNGNVVVEMNGKLWTPPVQSGLLAGTFREYLITKRVIEEKIIQVNDLQYCTNIWFINSVRKWIPVQIETHM